MTIYTRAGGPVEIVKAYKKWSHRGCYLLQVKLTAPYPDGSGAAEVGKIMWAGERLHQGWLSSNDFVADNGIREIFDTADDAPDGAPEPALATRLLHDYWPHMFDKKGKPIYETRRTA
jgi:hypothetical protein